MNLESWEERELSSIQDFFPTENYNAVIVSDDHHFEYKSYGEKHERIQEEAELIEEAARAFNAGELFHLGDCGSSKTVAEILDSTDNIHEAIIIKGDEDKKSSGNYRDAGWVWERNTPGREITGDTMIKTGEEIAFNIGLDYPIMLDHHPGSPNMEMDRNFQHEWFADHLWVHKTGNAHSETMKQPVVAISGHSHAPYSRTLANSIALNSGSYDCNWNIADKIVDRNIYAISFAPEEVQTALIDVETERIAEYDIFNLGDQGFEHVYSFSEYPTQHPEQRFKAEPVEKLKPVIGTVERLYPEETQIIGD